MEDYLIRGSLEERDPEVARLIELERARQKHRIILIPSESTAPAAVREAMGSVLQNIYAEGYPPEETRWLTEDEILDYDARLADYRRYSDPRYYKGVEYADIVEALARRRCAELYANKRTPADSLYVNVQPLSGAPANNAVYGALCEVGDTVMGMDLLHGGHLTHGSPVNRSGKNYNIVTYGVDPETERLDYDEIRRIAMEARPKMIIGGFTSYPWAADWGAFREICDACGAYLLADISHIAGLVAAGVYPSPVGIADVVTFTTHKTLDGPRGAVMLTHNSNLARKLDRAVFPGEQGGPHVNIFAAMATAFKFAMTDDFKALQTQTVTNAKRLAEKLAARGLRIPYGGTDTHMLLVDCKSVTGADGTPLSGDMAARILDNAGIVCNRNTIPGDRSAFSASGIRLGTPWATQRGFKEAEIDTLADIMADILLACKPFAYTNTRGRAQLRAKVDFEAFEDAKRRVLKLAEGVGFDAAGDIIEEAKDYPHTFTLVDAGRAGTITITDADAGRFLDFALTSDVHALGGGGSQPTAVLDKEGRKLSEGQLKCIRAGEYELIVKDKVDRIAAWLRDLSDGFVTFDHQDLYAKLPGPVIVKVTAHDTMPDADGVPYALEKAYFIGCRMLGTVKNPDPLPAFEWQPEESGDLKKTPLNALHRELGANMVDFGGWEMPVKYGGAREEHLAVRQGAGVFDVAHMGIFALSGGGAEDFLNATTTNDVSDLAVGKAQYGYLLAPDGACIDDIMLYRLEPDRFMMVVNASNNDKDWAWLKSVREGRALIDSDRPWAKAPGRDDVTLRDLRAESAGDERRVDIALQGPNAREVLFNLGASDEAQRAVKGLGWAGIACVEIGGYDLIVTRTGYTGERIAYELYVHPDRAAGLFKALVEAGAVPCGLAARDSLRIEAGLPLYGHELAGPLALGPADAGFAGYVKLWKPFFAGKAAYLAHEAGRESEIVRFGVDERGGRPPNQGDPVIDRRGRVVGTVTSCSMDTEGSLIGMAYVKKDHAKTGTGLGLFALGGRPARESKPLHEIGPGDRVTIHQNITVLSRFPK